MKQAIAMCGWGPEGSMKRVCWKCFANCTTLPFTDPSIGALWRAHRMTHAVFMQLSMMQGTFMSELFNIPGFKYEFIAGDLMHSGDLGILLYLFGNLIVEFILEMGAKIGCAGFLGHIYGNG